MPPIGYLYDSNGEVSALDTQVSPERQEELDCYKQIKSRLNCR